MVTDAQMGVGAVQPKPKQGNKPDLFKSEGPETFPTHTGVTRAKPGVSGLIPGEGHPGPLLLCGKRRQTSLQGRRSGVRSIQGKGREARRGDAGGGDRWVCRVRTPAFSGRLQQGGPSLLDHIHHVQGSV